MGYARGGRLGVGLSERLRGPWGFDGGWAGLCSGGSGFDLLHVLNDLLKAADRRGAGACATLQLIQVDAHQVQKKLTQGNHKLYQCCNTFKQAQNNSSS